VNTEIREAFEKAAKEIVEFKTVGPEDAKTLVIAHGIVAAAAKDAVQQLNAENVSVRLFRPVTLRPFPDEALREAVKGVERIIIAESAVNQLARFVKDALYGVTDAPITEYFRPSMSILTEEIIELVKKD